MVNTRSTAFENETNQPTGPISQQLAAIASKLETIDTLAADVAAPKAQTNQTQQLEKSKAPETSFGNRQRDRSDEEDVDSHNWSRNHMQRHYTKMDFPKFEGGDPRGWILKAEKYFRYCQTLDEMKIEIAAMYLEGDALDLFAWINNERTIVYWEELVKVLQENYGPPELQNPDEHLCNIKQVGTVHEYRQEFAKRAARVKLWPEHCLLGVFLNGLKEEAIMADLAEIFLHAILGKTKGTTMKLQGALKGKQVIILVDSG